MFFLLALNHINHTIVSLLKPRIYSKTICCYTIRVPYQYSSLKNPPSLFFCKFTRFLLMKLSQAPLSIHIFTFISWIFLLFITYYMMELFLNDRSITYKISFDITKSFYYFFTCFIFFCKPQDWHSAQFCYATWKSETQKCCIFYILQGQTTA